MAGAGAKKFAANSLLSSDDVNNYLADQVIMRFATAVARDAAFGGAGEPTLAEGMTCYLDDLDVIRRYSGSAWVGLHPIGSLMPFAGSTAPNGWLLCSNVAVSRTTYADLFAVISTTYGPGDGSTTFNVPDLRGRTIAGIDNMGGTDAGILSIANTPGTTTGTETITLTTAQIPSHNHTQDSHNHTQNAHAHNFAQLDGYDSYTGTGNRRIGVQGGGQVTDVVITATATNQATTATNQATGGGGSHNNMQPTMVLNYLIAV